MEHEKKRDRWEGIIREWPESALSQREYCLRKSLSYSAFRYWYRRLGSGNSQTKATRRVSVVEISRAAVNPRAIAKRSVANGEVETGTIVIERKRFIKPCCQLPPRARHSAPEGTDGTREKARSMGRHYSRVA